MGNWFGCIQVGEYTRGIQERRGRFQKELKPGIHWIPWCFCYRLAGQVSMKAQQYVVRSITKTKDDVFVTVVASVRFAVLDVADKNNAKKAFYAHNDTKSLIEAHSFDAIKTAVSSHTFVELFEYKGDLAATVNNKLNQSISAEFGFGNFKTLIIDIAPQEFDKRIISITNAGVLYGDVWLVDFIGIRRCFSGTQMALDEAWKCSTLIGDKKQSSSIDDLSV